jgi:hypothetical protein
VPPRLSPHEGELTLAREAVGAAELAVVEAVHFQGAVTKQPCKQQQEQETKRREDEDEDRKREEEGKGGRGRGQGGRRSHHQDHHDNLTINVPS